MTRNSMFFNTATLPIYRWVTCLSLVFGVHLIGLTLLFHEQSKENTAAALADAVVLDIVAAPPATQPDKPQPSVPHSQNPVTQSPRDTQKDTIERQEPISHKDTPTPQRNQGSMPSPKADSSQKHSPPKEQHVSTSSHDRQNQTDQSQNRETPPSSSPTEASLSARENAFSNWEGLISAQLEKYKHYPRMARLRHQEGVAVIRIVISRTGDVLSVALDRTSGFQALDREALKLPKRATPLPPPPQHMNDPSTITIRVNFELI